MPNMSMNLTCSQLVCSFGVPPFGRVPSFTVSTQVTSTLGDKGALFKDSKDALGPGENDHSFACHSDCVYPCGYSAGYAGHIICTRIGISLSDLVLAGSLGRERRPCFECLDGHAFHETWRRNSRSLEPSEKVGYPRSLPPC